MALVPTYINKTGYRSKRDTQFSFHKLPLKRILLLLIDCTFHALTILASSRSTVCVRIHVDPPYRTSHTRERASERAHTQTYISVSYTHLDVYKRQVPVCSIQTRRIQGQLRI